VNADEWAGGELFTLDVGTDMEEDNTYEETQYVETQVLLIVHLLAGLELAKDTLHKVGTTGSVFILAFEKTRRANCFNGIVLEDKSECCRIGGTLCSYCHSVEIQTYDTPEPSPRRRMMA
jgi:hypothetical protein